MPSIRRALLEEAAELVDGDRNASYGPPTQDFRRTAELLTIVLKPLLKDNARIFPHHVAVIQLMLKASRTVWSPHKKDNWIDTAGYAACGVEVVEEELSNGEIDEYLTILRGEVPPLELHMEDIASEQPEPKVADLITALEEEPIQEEVVYGSFEVVSFRKVWRKCLD